MTALVIILILILLGTIPWGGGWGWHGRGYTPSYVVGLGNLARIDGSVPARACYARNGVGSNSKPPVTPSRVGERIQMNAA